MFDNIGRKIKGFAKAICWIGIITCWIAGIKMISDAVNRGYVDDELILMGIGVIVLGSLLSWVSSLVLCGFGRLVENSELLPSIAAELKKNMKPQTAHDNSPTKPTPPSDSNEENEEKEQTEEDWVCPRCGAKNRSYFETCPDCFTPKPAPGSSAAKSEEDSDEEWNDYVWICPICKKSNPRAKAYCSCGTPQPTRKR